MNGPHICGHHAEAKPDSCPVCKQHVAFVSALPPKGTPTLTNRVSLPCIHLGSPVPAPPGANPAKRWSSCDHPRKPLGDPVCPCKGCGPKCVGYQPEDEPDLRPDDPRVGVVIGSYGWPSLIPIQVRLIRITCGAVPILVSDDKPHTGDSDTIRRFCESQDNVLHWPNPDKIGHTGGDISAFYKGVIWGAANGLNVVAKISQRFLVERTRWLQDGAEELLRSGLPAAGRTCKGTWNFDLRTEAVLMKVADWFVPRVLHQITPRRFFEGSNGTCAETIIYRVIRDHLGGVYWPWSLIGTDRMTKNPGVVWHDANDRSDYSRIAQRLGCELESGFHTNHWLAAIAAGEYSYG